MKAEQQMLTGTLDAHLHPYAQKDGWLLELLEDGALVISQIGETGYLRLESDELKDLMLMIDHQAAAVHGSALEPAFIHHASNDSPGRLEVASPG